MLEHVSSAFGIIHTPEPLRARLRATARICERQWIDLDASRSSGGFSIHRYRFWAIDARNARVVYEPRCVDTPRHAIALPPGPYRLFVEVEDMFRARSVASQEVSITPDVIVTECGALGSTWQMTTTFSFTSGSSFDLSTLVKEVPGGSSSTTLWIEAFGANGGHGGALDIYEGGSPGDEGFALFVGTIDGITSKFGTTTLYYLLGQNGTHNGWGGGDGGASTVVAAADWPSSLSELVLIAGGSGGGGASGSVDNGHDGGSGGTANSSYSIDTAVTVAGTSGNGGNAGGGGNGETAGSGGGSAKDGTNGMGGWGGIGSGPIYPAWIGGTPSAYGDKPERGGGGNCADEGGAGAGGYGGGGGGGTSDGKGCGGGGGGSYAAPSIMADDTASSLGRLSSGSATGVVKVIFNPS